MTQKRLERIIRRDRRRKVSQGIGAAAGTALSLYVISLIFGGNTKKEKK